MLIRDIAVPESAFFLKSEYAPLSESWPPLAFTQTRVKLMIERDYQPDTDFILYSGTLSPKTENPAHRGRLLSLLKIDKSATHPTNQLIPGESERWARQHYPGQWNTAFSVVQGWSITALPRSSEILPLSYPLIGQGKNRGSILRIQETEKERLLDLYIEPVDQAEPTPPATP